MFDYFRDFAVNRKNTVFCMKDGFFAAAFNVEHFSAPYSVLGIFLCVFEKIFVFSVDIHEHQHTAHEFFFGYGLYEKFNGSDAEKFKGVFLY